MRNSIPFLIPFLIFIQASIADVSVKSSIRHSYLAAEKSLIEESGYTWCDSYVREEYDRGVHVLSVFLVLTASTLGTLIPIFQGQKKSGNVSLLINCGKHFGTGVILATAFIHMLPGAVQMLTSPCLPKMFHSHYTAFAGLFAMSAGLFMHLLEYLAMEYNDSLAEMEIIEPLPEAIRKHSHYQTMQTASTEATALLAHDYQRHHQNQHQHHHHHHHGGFAFTQNQQKLSTYLLEFGIACHSIIIGITLGVTGDVKFAGLLCALLLHQFFEGFALGARISELGISRLKKLYMSLVFIFTTPSGIIIGIMLASSYNPNSMIALVVQGTLDSVSAGILIYAAYANLLAAEITNSTSFRKLPGRTKVYYFLSIYVGVAIMASLGRWA